MDKPVVYYSFVIEPITLGYPALVHPINHAGEHVSNKKLARTSKVIKIINDNSFETENTIYRSAYHDNEADLSRYCRSERLHRYY